MRYAYRLKILNRQNQLVENVASLILRNSLASDNLIVKFSPIRLLHDEKKLFFCFVDIEELDEMRMSDFLQNRYLPCNSIVVFLSDDF